MPGVTVGYQSALEFRAIGKGVQAMGYDPQQYLDEHNEMWARFMKWTVWGTAAVIIALLLMAAFLL